MDGFYSSKLGQICVAHAFYKPMMLQLSAYITDICHSKMY